MGRGLPQGIAGAVSPRTLVWLGVVIVVVGLTYGLVGTFGGWFWQTGPAEITISNSANQTYTFEVSVVEYPSNATTLRDDGLTGDYQIGPGLRSHSPGENYVWTEVELPESARLHGRYSLQPGEVSNTSIEEFSPDFAVVVVIYQAENEIDSWVSAHCSGNLAFLEVTMYEYGPSSAYNC